MSWWPILPTLIPLFLSGIGTDASSSTGRGVDTTYGSIGGGDDASSSIRRDIDDSFVGRCGENMS